MDIRGINPNNDPKFLQIQKQKQIEQQKREQQVEQLQQKQEDSISLSEKAKKLAEARAFYQKFLEKKAKEIEQQRMEKIKQLKEEMQKKPNSPVHKIAQKIASQYFGLTG